MGARRRCVIAMVCFLGLASSREAPAALPPPPFDLRMASSTVAHGDVVRIRVTARAGADAGPVDLYLVSVYAPRALFLDPGGTWSAAPVPIRAGLGTRPSATAIEMEWRATPPGWIALGLVVVPADADPLDRSRWRHAPLVRWVRVEAERHAGGREWLTLGALAALSAVGVGLVTRVRSR